MKYFMKFNSQEEANGYLADIPFVGRISGMKKVLLGDGKKDASKYTHYVDKDNDDFIRWSGKYLILIDDDGNQTVLNFTDGVITNISGYSSTTQEAICGPDIIVIADGAFENFDELDSITFKNKSGYTIGEKSFAHCTDLDNIDLSDCTEIGPYAFSGVTGISAITLDKIEIIHENAFQGTSGLSIIDITSITDPDKIPELENENAFPDGTVAVIANEIYADDTNIDQDGDVITVTNRNGKIFDNRNWSRATGHTVPESYKDQLYSPILMGTYTADVNYKDTYIKKDIDVVFNIPYIKDIEKLFANVTFSFNSCGVIKAKDDICAFEDNGDEYYSNYTQMMHVEESYMYATINIVINKTTGKATYSLSGAGMKSGDKITATITSIYYEE